MRTMQKGGDAIVAGHAIWQDGGQRPRTSPQGRVCAHEGCGTVLSIYNRRDACAEHEVPCLRPPRFGRPRNVDIEMNRRMLTLADFLQEGV